MGRLAFCEVFAETRQQPLLGAKDSRWKIRFIGFYRGRATSARRAKEESHSIHYQFITQNHMLNVECRIAQ
ncbi:MAG: hypothetical protein ACI9R3_004855, partial [Verrucomicrobiales bacterium]